MKLEIDKYLSLSLLFILLETAKKGKNSRPKERYFSIFSLEYNQDSSLTAKLEIRAIIFELKSNLTISRMILDSKSVAQTKMSKLPDKNFGDVSEKFQKHFKAYKIGGGLFW